MQIIIKFVYNGYACGDIQMNDLLPGQCIQLHNNWSEAVAMGGNDNVFSRFQVFDNMFMKEW